jgi:hypothetical protein
MLGKIRREKLYREVQLTGSGHSVQARSRMRSAVPWAPAREGGAWMPWDEDGNGARKGRETEDRKLQARGREKAGRGCRGTRTATERGRVARRKAASSRREGERRWGVGAAITGR